METTYFLAKSLFGDEFLIETSRAINHNMYQSLKKITEEEFKKLSKKINIIKMDSSGETFQFTYNKKQNKYICKYSSLSENFNQYDF